MLVRIVRHSLVLFFAFFLFVVLGGTAYADNLSVGNQFACAISDSGSLKCWGANEWGQLGNGTEPPADNRNESADSSLPTQVVGLTSGVTDVSVGYDHTCAVVAGAVKCWGYNESNQLATPGLTNSPVPVQVPGLESGVTSVATGYRNSCAIQSGMVKCWGNALDWSLFWVIPGANGYMPVTTIPGITNASKVVVGGYHACALVLGSAKCFGYPGSSGFRPLGAGDDSDGASINQVFGLDSGVTDLEPYCAVQNAAAKCWQSYLAIQFNVRYPSFISLPTSITSLASNVTNITTSDSGICAIASQAAFCAGTSADGRLGNGVNDDGSASQIDVVPVSGLASGVSEIDSGANSTCAIKNQVVKCWGSNYRGQLGDGTNDHSSVPVDIGVTTSPSIPEDPPTTDPPIPASPGVPAASGARIVLLTGVDSEAGQTDRATHRDHCGRAGAMNWLCRHFVSKGHTVYVVPAKQGSGTTINTKGRLADNAKRFASWMNSNSRRELRSGKKPFLVGYSFGGLIARSAISKHGVRAGALITLGTPHDGSFAADALVVASSSCVVSIFLIQACVAATAKVIESPYVLDLTRSARSNDRMASTGIPTLTLAGTKGFLVPGHGEYFNPNDTTVGKSSAFGSGANLGRRTTTETFVSHGDLNKNKTVGDIASSHIEGLLAGGFGALSVRQSKLTNQSPSPSSFAQFSSRTDAGGPRSARNPKKTRLAFVPQGKRIGPTTQLSQAGVVYSTSQFSLTCAGAPVASFPISDTLHSAYATPGCMATDLNSATSGFIPTSVPRAIRGHASVNRKGNKITITVAGIRSVSIVQKKRKLATRRAVRGRAVISITRTKFVRGPSWVTVRSAYGDLAAPIVLP